MRPRRPATWLLLASRSFGAGFRPRSANHRVESRTLGLTWGQGGSGRDRYSRRQPTSRPAGQALPPPSGRASAGAWRGPATERREEGRKRPEAAFGIRRRTANPPHSCARRRDTPMRRQSHSTRGLRCSGSRVVDRLQSDPVLSRRFDPVFFLLQDGSRGPGRKQRGGTSPVSRNALDAFSRR